MLKFFGLSRAEDTETAEREAENEAELRRKAEEKGDSERRIREESERNAREAEKQKQAAELLRREEEQKRAAAEDDRNEEKRRKEEAIQKAEKLATEKEDAERRACEAKRQQEEEASKNEKLKKEQEELAARLETLTPKPKAFREIDMGEAKIKSMKDKLIKIKPYKKIVKVINILLLGLVGHGKTSFVNTVYSTLKEEVTALSSVGTAERTVTRKFRKHKLRMEIDSEGSEELASFRLCDTMGVEANDGISEKDLAAIMAGHIEDQYIFNTLQPIDRKSPLYLPDPTLEDRMHCVGICVNAARLPTLNGPLLDKLKRIKNDVNSYGLSFIVILTNIDGICEIVQNDPYQTFRSERVEQAVRETADMFGVPANQVFPVKNYEHEVDCVGAISSMALYACQKMISYANSYLENESDAFTVEEGRKSSDDTGGRNPEYSDAAGNKGGVDESVNDNEGERQVGANGGDVANDSSKAKKRPALMSKFKNVFKSNPKK